ncbi:flagellar protein FlaG [Caldibacillus thermoamylovorans]|uniref:flagellar protein FlaG n=1 Tax=Caldibacillus thermoamylovorans TaxID=35841 RepID=UPI00203A4578|nr:flagellar protein FlaG [Caldibacillus thermoamylovorans]MCM3799487.1 flagellar protein FlaG [Caldibacillus thermoamylovorans]
MVEKLINQEYVSTTRLTTNGINNQESNMTVHTKRENENYGNPISEPFQKVEKDKVEKIVEGLNDFLSPIPTSLRFVFHEKLNEYYVTVVNDDTHEVIKEIPPKKMLDLYAAIVEKIGLIVDEKI